MVNYIVSIVLMWAIPFYVITRLIQSYNRGFVTGKPDAYFQWGISAGFLDVFGIIINLGLSWLVWEFAQMIRMIPREIRFPVHELFREMAGAKVMGLSHKYASDRLVAPVLIVVYFLIPVVVWGIIYMRASRANDALMKKKG